MAYPYGEKWARDVFMSFWGVCTRTGNMLRVLAQYANEEGLSVTADDIQRALIESIRRKDSQALWSTFKRMCRKHSLRDTFAVRTFARVLLKRCGVVAENYRLDFDR